MGVGKITPCHDPNDYEVGLRHNLEKIVVINPDGTMNENALSYQGLDRFEAREKIVQELKEKGYLLKVEKIIHSVGHSERTDVMVEPYLSKQWFVKMRPLADKVLENQKNKETKVKFLPARYEKIMNHWMEITYDWCISRQLWWGHQIPAWYKEDQIYVGMTAPEGEGWVQDEDVLDTWFSSALWPFSTLGWPDETEDYKKYYPTNVLVTGYDIIPFWVNRMTFQGLHFTHKRPFEYCYIHGLIRDKEGRKMSKSLGNGVDPMDVIEKYGADALRYYLATSTAPGTDLRYDEEKVKSTWNFINKIWNASRFVLMNIEDLEKEDSSKLTDADKWILTRYNKTVKDVTKYMDKYEFQNVGSILYKFIWEDFCDQYIEMAKFSLENVSTKSTLKKVLVGILKMLHPFMPFVTEKIYSQIKGTTDALIISPYPKVEKKEIFIDEEEHINEVMTFVRLFRNKKAELNLGKEFKIEIKSEADYTLTSKLLKWEGKMIREEISLPYVVVEYHNYKIYLYNEHTETKEDAEKKQKEIETLEKSILKREQLLKNENFVSKAPQDLVSQERKKLQEEKEKLNHLKDEV